MKRITTIEGVMAPLPMANVDTDQIIPKQFLKRVERSGFGPYLFHDWAYDEENEPIPDFVLNKSEYRDAKVLVAGPNFGSGSSREHAPWALEDWGLEAVIAPSFADIFYNNCVNIGLLPIVLSDDDVDRLMSHAESAERAVIDLDGQSVVCGTDMFRFEMDPHIKHRLARGLDQIALTLDRETAISAYESQRAIFYPTTLELPIGGEI